MSEGMGPVPFFRDAEHSIRARKSGEEYDFTSDT